MSDFNHSEEWTYWSLLPINEMPKGMMITKFGRYKHPKRKGNHLVYEFIRVRGFIPLYECFRLCLIGCKTAYEAEW